MDEKDPYEDHEWSEDPNQFLDAISYYQRTIKELKGEFQRTVEELKGELELRRAQMAGYIKDKCERLQKLVRNCKVSSTEDLNTVKMVFTRGDMSVPVEASFMGFITRGPNADTWWTFDQEEAVADHINAALDKQ